MTSIADGSVKIQTTSESNPSTPCWFGEVVAISSYLRTHSVLSKINERVRFARRLYWLLGTSVLKHALREGE